ncbi:MAG: pilus assembly protein PilM [Candidatus Saccharibacteria bacterium]|nr:pilus assembly protein PilM [Candidatus Saccharibacteria bacterium]
MSIISRGKELAAKAKQSASSTKHQKNPDDYLLALDIGTEYVKALIAKKGKGALKVVGVGKAHEAPTNMYSGAIADIEGVAQTCEEALSKAEEMAGVRANEVVIGIAGELVKGNTVSIKYRRADASRPITDAEMEKIIHQVQQKAGERARKEVALETDNEDIEVRLINSALVSLRIDGYKVSNPIGFKGKEVIVQIYTAFAPLVHISAIERVCDELDLDLVTVAVEPFAVCRACLGDNTESNFSGIVMDIGGGTTDIAVVDDGGVEGTKMFSIGGRSFTRQIAQKLGLSFEEAEKLKLLADSPKVKPEIRKKFDAAIERNLEVWQSGVELAIEEFDQMETLPGQVLLCGGGAGLSAIQEILATGDWYKDLPFSRRPVVNIIEPDMIEGIENMTDRELDHTFVTAMGLLRVGMDTIAGAPENGSLKEKLSRLLKN